jgi:hypothetical protein
LVNINFLFKNDFENIAKTGNFIIKNDDIIFEERIIKNARLNGVYARDTDDIYINLYAYKDDVNFIEKISRTIQHEILHSCIHKILKKTYRALKKEEQIVALLLNYDYDIDY